MVKHNYRFANYATHSELFELQVEPGTTVGALKELAVKHLSSADNLCPMHYFGKWYCECRVGGRTRMMCIEERDNELPLAEAGLEDESLVYLEGPMFSEEQADVGRAIAAVRAESKVAIDQLASQHTTQVQVQSLMDELRSLKELVMKSQQKQARFQEATNTKLYISGLIHNQRPQADKVTDSAMEITYVWRVAKDTKEYVLYRTVEPKSKFDKFLREDVIDTMFKIRPTFDYLGISVSVVRDSRPIKVVREDDEMGAFGLTGNRCEFHVEFPLEISPSQLPKRGLKIRCNRRAKTTGSNIQ